MGLVVAAVFFMVDSSCFLMVVVLLVVMVAVVVLTLFAFLDIVIPLSVLPVSAHASSVCGLLPQRQAAHALYTAWASHSA